jgi:hypothetical protein
VKIDIADPRAGQRAPLDEPQDLILGRDARTRKRAEHGEDFTAIGDVAQRDLAQTERVHDRATFSEQAGQRSRCSGEVVEPDRGIDQHSHSGEATPGRCHEVRLRATEFDQSPSRLALDERF